jgi:hypothetical protein
VICHPQGNLFYIHIVFMLLFFFIFMFFTSFKDTMMILYIFSLKKRERFFSNALNTPFVSEDCMICCVGMHSPRA